MTARFICMALALLLCARINGGKLGGNARATSETATAPEMIGENTVSGTDDDLGGSVSPDGKTLYFERSAPPHYLYVILESHLVNGKWGTPEIMPFSGQYRDTDPVLSPDGTRMLFASDRPVDGVDRHHFYIWSTNKTDHSWSTPEFVKGPVNDAFDQVFASIAANGDIYFTSSRKTGNYDIFRTRLVGDQYQPAEDMGPDFNGPGISSFEAFIAPDESYLLIGSFGRKDSVGSSDLYISYNQNGLWTKPRNLGPGINSTSRDYSPRVSADGKWMYFTSERTNSPLAAPLSYKEFTRFSRSVFNGLGNLYRVPMAEVFRATKP